MKILIHDYAGHAFPVELSRSLANRGHRVTHAFADGLITPRGNLTIVPSDPQSLIFEKVAMSPDYRANKYNFIKRRAYEVAYGKELRALLNRTRPDVVLSGNTPTEPQWEFAKAASEAGVPFISWVQDFYSIAVEKLARKKLFLIGSLAGVYYRYLDKCCLRKSAAVVAITDDFVPLLAEYGVVKEKISIIPNWAPLNELPLRPKFNLWSDRNLLTGKFVFLYSGTLAMKHNPDLLLQLARQFKSDLNVRIVVISEGPGASYLTNVIEAEKISNVVLMPFQSVEQMSYVLASADVLVAVLERDAGIFSVPSKVLTYHAAGRPILAAIPQENLAARIINAESTGLCFEPEDDLGFLAGACELRSNVQKRDIYSRNARLYAESRFDIEKITAKFEKIFEQCYCS